MASEDSTGSSKPKRTLREEGSHADAPLRHAQRTDEDPPPTWAKQLMQKMTDVEGKVDNMATSVDGAVKVATEAKAAVETLRCDVTIQVGKIWNDMERNKEDQAKWQEMIEEKVAVTESSSTNPAQAARGEEVQNTIQQIQATIAEMKTGSSGGTSAKAPNGKGGAKGETNMEKRSRTINFGKFPDDTKVEDIVTMINEKVKAVEQDIEEVFAYGKKIAERGGARFKSSDAMWEYVMSQAGNHQYKYKDTTIYCNADSGSIDPESETAQREKAVRKVVRAIIEANGGDGKLVKQEIDARYRKGVVIWKDQRVAEWMDGNMKLINAGTQFQESFQKLMGQ